jgi:hypothetical protein
VYFVCLWPEKGYLNGESMTPTSMLISPRL